MASGRGMQLTLTNILILILLTLVLVQAVGLLIGSSTIKLGPIFILVVIGSAAFFSITLLKKSTDDFGQVSKHDILVMVLITGLALVMLFFLKDFLPEIFTASLVQLQAILGF